MSEINAAENLEGTILPGDWQVLSRIIPRPGDTGGNFSINYWVEKEGRRGFCKVLNYSWLIRSQAVGMDPLAAIAEATATYQFERDLARECVNLSRVVTALHDGSFYRDGFPLGLVSFIIFEVADGDIRRVLDDSDQLDLVVRLRSVHHLATGLRQLHQRQVAHQDVKPSNTLVFPPDTRGGRITKVGDLGRATVSGRPMLHDEFPIAGDPSYAPPEGLYLAVPTAFGPRRLACDLYQLGSMICFVFTGASFNTFLHHELHPSQNWHNWNGTYEDAYPYVEDAYSRVIQGLSAYVDEDIRERVIALVQHLCHPDPLLRGHPRSRLGHGSPYSLDRIVSELDLLSRRAEISVRRVS